MSVHWVIQENESDSVEARAIAQAAEGGGHVAHPVSLTKGLEVAAIPGLPDDVPVVCQGHAFVPRALHYLRLKAGLFFDPAMFRWSAYQAGWKGAMLSTDGRA